MTIERVGETHEHLHGLVLKAVCVLLQGDVRGVWVGILVIDVEGIETGLLQSIHLVDVADYVVVVRHDLRGGHRRPGELMGGEEDASL